MKNVPQATPRGDADRPGFGISGTKELQPVPERLVAEPCPSKRCAPMASRTIIAVRLTPIAMSVRFRSSNRPFHISGRRLTIRRAVVSKATTMPIIHNTCLFVGRQGPDAFSDSDLLLRAGFSGSKGFPHAAYVPVASIVANHDEWAMN